MSKPKNKKPFPAASLLKYRSRAGRGTAVPALHAQTPAAKTALLEMPCYARSTIHLTVNGARAP